MKSKKDEVVQNILILLKLDAQNLFQRIHQRKREYLMEYSLKRTREPFKEIFFSRYQQATFEELKLCSQDTLLALDQFYKLVEEMRWYLFHTQDMTNAVEDKVNVHIRQLKKKYDILMLYIDADLSNSSENGEAKAHEGTFQGQWSEQPQEEMEENLFSEFAHNLDEEKSESHSEENFEFSLEKDDEFDSKKKF